MKSCHIFAEGGLLNCINFNPVPSGTRSHPDEAPENFASLQTCSEFQLGSGDRVKRCLSDIQPCGLFSRAQDALKTSGNVIESSFYEVLENLSSVISSNNCRIMPYRHVILSAWSKQALGTQTPSPLRNRRDLEQHK